MKRCRRYWILLVGLVLLLACSTVACEPPAPAEFELVSLDIAPQEVLPGEEVNITVEVTNIGGSEGTYTATLAFGLGEETKTVEVAPQETETVLFTVVKDQPGNWDVRVGGLSDTLRVLRPAEFTVAGLDISPIVAATGETVTVSAEVANTGEVGGTYSASLHVDGMVEQTRLVEVSPGASVTVTFSMAEDEAGTYDIELDGLTGTVSVSAVPVYLNPRTYRVVRTLTVENESAGVNVLRIWMPALGLWDSQRDVVMEESVPMPTGEWKDPQSGTGVVFWEFHNEPGKASSLTIKQELRLTCYAIKYVVDPNEVGEYDKSTAEYALYTRSEKYLEADDREIAKTAKSLAGIEADPYGNAYSIYEWVKGHMRYQLIEGLGGAKFAFENGYGECGDYSALFVALCRAVGIPARPVVGRWATSVEGDWHAWAEFYLPLYGWIPVDVTAADVFGGEEYFGRLDNRRIIFNKQYNVVLHPKPYFVASEWALLQAWLWEYGGRPGEIQAEIDYSVTQLHSN